MKHIFKNKEDIHADAWILSQWSDSSKKTYTKNFCNAKDAEYAALLIKKNKGEYLDVTHGTLPSSAEMHVYCIGLGEKKICTARRVRTAARKVLLQTKAARASRIAVCVDDFNLDSVPLQRTAELLAVHFEMAQYEFHQYKQKPKDEWRWSEYIFYYSEHINARKKIQKGIRLGSVIGSQVNNARDLANTPGGDMTPTRLAHSAAAYGKKYGYTTTVLGEKEMKKMGMGGILGVSRGSSEEAQFIIMEYANGSQKKRPIVFVGKGITFDSGGLHLKPGKNMNEMHLDMSGGAAVIGAMGAIAQLRLEAHVIGVIPAVENMPSSESYRPGDILTSLSGKTIEIDNTDAEGRVVLADALTYVEKYNPSVVIDIATLTGACSVALGRHAIGLLTPHDTFADFLSDMGEESGDYVWRLPLWEEYEADVKGIFGDIVNASKDREAGTINGGMFLYQFAKKFDAWAHLDIASTMTSGSDGYLAKGASGTSVRLLIEVVRHMKEKFNH